MTTEPRVSAWADTTLAGCGLPEPPGDLGSRLESLGLLRVGTREDAPALRGLGTFAVEAEEHPDLEYVLAGVEEIAFNLAGLHYIVSYGHLLLATQVRVDVADGIDVPPASRDTLDGAGELQSLVLSVAAAGKLSVGGKLIVVDSPFGTRAWKWTGDRPTDGGAGINGAGAFLVAL